MNPLPPERSSSNMGACDGLGSVRQLAKDDRFSHCQPPGTVSRFLASLKPEADGSGMPGQMPPAPEPAALAAAYEDACRAPVPVANSGLSPRGR